MQLTDFKLLVPTADRIVDSWHKRFKVLCTKVFRKGACLQKTREDLYFALSVRVFCNLAFLSFTTTRISPGVLAD